jgi:hypothetical protein
MSAAATKKIGLACQVDTNYQLECLKDAIRVWEIANPGTRITSNKCSEFTRAIISRVHAEMAKLAPHQLAEYHSGAKGATYAFKTNLCAWASLMFFSEQERYELQGNPHRDAIVKKKSVTVRNWRNKLTAERGGFPLITQIIRLNMDNQADDTGRSGAIWHINLRYVFGEKWYADRFCGEKIADAETPVDGVFFDLRSKVLSNYPSISNPSKEITDNTVPTASNEIESLCDGIKKCAQLQITTGGAAIGAAAIGGAATGEAATGGAGEKLWLFMVKTLYATVFLTQKIRLGRNMVYFPTRFTDSTVLEAVQNMEKNLDAIVLEYGVNRVQAQEIAVNAIKNWQIWLGEDAERWIYTPKNALSTSNAHGTLLSFLRKTHQLDGKVLAHTTPKNLDETVQNIGDLFDMLAPMGIHMIKIGWLAKVQNDRPSGHIAACIAETKRQFQKHRAAGTSIKCASKYFARLVREYDTHSLNAEKDLQAHKIQRINLQQDADKVEVRRSLEQWISKYAESVRHQMRIDAANYWNAPFMLKDDLSYGIVSLMRGYAEKVGL